MTPKIRQLAEQAGFYFYDITDVNGENLGYSVESDSFESVDKLVESIVRECAIIADLADENKCDCIGANILSHFGVKDNE